MRGEIGNESAYRVPDTYLHIFPQMLSDLEMNLQELDLIEYGMMLSALDEVYINVCADHADDEVDLNIDLMNCNRFRLHTGIRLYLMQWKAMFYKKFLFTFKNPTMFILQCITVLVFALFSYYTYDITKAPHPPLNISMNMYDNAEVLMTISNESRIRNKMLPIAYYMEDYFKKFQPESKFTAIKKNSIVSLLADPSKKRIEQLNIFDIGGFHFNSTKKVTMYFSNVHFHSIPIMINLWTNAIAKYELGEDYNVEVVNKPINFKEDLVKETERYMIHNAIFTVLGLSLAFAFFNHHMTKHRAGREVLLQFIGGLRVSTFWLSNIVWDYLLLSLYIAFMMSMAFIFHHKEEKNDMLMIYLSLLNLGINIVAFAYVNSFLFKDPAFSVAFSAMKDILLALVFFPLIIRVKEDQHSDLTRTFWNITDYILKLNPAYGTISIIHKLNYVHITNQSCQKACALLVRFRPDRYPNCTALSLCLNKERGRKICCCEYTL